MLYKNKYRYIHHAYRVNVYVYPLSWTPGTGSIKYQAIIWNANKWTSMVSSTYLRDCEKVNNEQIHMTIKLKQQNMNTETQNIYSQYQMFKYVKVFFLLFFVVSSSFLRMHFRNINGKRFLCASFTKCKLNTLMSNIYLLYSEKKITFVIQSSNG